MKKYSSFLKGFMIIGLMIGSGVVSVASAQSVMAGGATGGVNGAGADSGAPVAEAPSQTLFQEDAVAKVDARPQAATESQAKPDSLAGSPAATTGIKGETEPTPSLADYLNEEKTKMQGAATDGANKSATDSPMPQIPGVDPNAPGLNLGVSDAENAEKERMAAVTAKAKEDAILRREAFKATTDQAMPLKPSEIRRILEMYDETRQAVETPIYPTPEPESAFQKISLDPGAKPLVVKTAMGNVTTVSLVDITGQPWPIQDLTWAGDFQIEQPEKGSHMLRITPTSEFAVGNISMRLLGLNPPVIFSLKAERKSVHVRLDVQVPEIGPKGVVPPMEAPITTKAGDDFLTGVLMGVVKGSDTVRLQVDGIDGRTTAYKNGDMMYIRTPYTMLSPAWLKSMQSADGTKVYSMNFTPVVLLSDKGKMVRAYLSYKETSDEQY